MKHLITISLLTASLAISPFAIASNKSRLADIIVAHNKLLKTIADTKETHRAARERFQTCEGELSNPPLEAILKLIPEGLSSTSLAKILLLQEWNTSLVALKDFQKNPERFALIVDFWLPGTKDQTVLTDAATDTLASVLELGPLYPTQPAHMTESAFGAKISALQRATLKWQSLESGERSVALESLSKTDFNTLTELQIDESLDQLRKENDAISETHLSGARALSARHFEQFNRYALNMRRFIILRNDMINVETHLKQLAETEAAIAKDRAMVQRMVDADKAPRPSSKGDR
ncbi:MAG TPA: hypothetical protein VM901_12630 [Bdellovibrionota bacterium]|nr:hypothetical protein [Bdellovibrionota bacterium]